MDNEELILMFKAIDQYDYTYDPIVDGRTKENLKSLLMSGADPYSSEFISKFSDEYHLFRKARHIYEYLSRQQQ